MIGTLGADFILLIIAIWIVAAAVVAGALTSLVRRRRWGLKAALIDAALAAGVAVALYFLASVVDGDAGFYKSIPTLAFVIAVASVIIRTRCRRVCRATSRQPLDRQKEYESARLANASERELRFALRPTGNEPHDENG